MKNEYTVRNGFQIVNLDENAKILRQVDAVYKALAEGCVPEGYHLVDVPFRRCRQIGEKRTPEGNVIRVFTPADCTKEDHTVERLALGDEPLGE